MNAVCLLGSPRPNGNSASIAGCFCRTAGDLGIDVQTMALNDLSYSGCQGCMACKTGSDKCVIQDDLTAVLKAVRAADVLVLATPVYYADVTSQLKAFIDRTFGYLEPDFTTNPKPSRLSPDRTLVFIQTQSFADESLYADIFGRYERFFKVYGYDKTYLIRTCGVSAPGEVTGRKQVMQRAKEIAQEIAANAG